MDLEEIRELVMLLENTSLTELKVHTEDFKLTLRKGSRPKETASIPAPAIETKSRSGHRLRRLPLIRIWSASIHPW